MCEIELEHVESLPNLKNSMVDFLRTQKLMFVPFLHMVRLRTPPDANGSWKLTGVVAPELVDDAVVRIAETYGNLTHR